MRLPFSLGLLAACYLLAISAPACGDSAEHDPAAQGGTAGSENPIRGGSYNTGGVATSRGGHNAQAGGGNAGAPTSQGGSSSGGKAANAGTPSSGGNEAVTQAGGGSGGGGSLGGAGGDGGTSAIAGSAGNMDAGECPRSTAPVARGQIDDEYISEASGIAASFRSDGVFYVVNDSGSNAAVYAVTGTGELVATLNLGGALNEDWEDVAVGPGPEAGQTYVYVADIGDNDRVRTTSIVVHRLLEPALSASERDQELSVTPVSLYLRYPDGPHNAETLLVDPRNGDFYIVTKGDSDGSRIYHAPAPHSTSNVMELVYVLSLQFGQSPLPGNALTTSGSIARDGSSVLLRSYDHAFWWYRAPNQSLANALTASPCALPIAADETQGEGITFTRDGNAYVTIAEGEEPTLYEIGLER
ncbi:MAG: hypothetical protein ACOY0T_10630 [Myxococcota bacterium]